MTGQFALIDPIGPFEESTEQLKLLIICTLASASRSRKPNRSGMEPHGQDDQESGLSNRTLDGLGQLQLDIRK